VPEDHLSFGAKFVNFYAKMFLGLRHRDKDHQYALLQQYLDVDWVGVRPLQIREAPKTEKYQVGFIPFSGTSWISFADVAHAMISMLDNKDWLQKAPIIRY
jgi:putative NADH-flavin reductase